MKPLIVKNLTLSIEMEMKTRKLFKNVVLNSDAKENAVILEGTFTEFNGGSRALRFWVGLGAGKTYLTVKGRLIDAGTGKELAEKLAADPRIGYLTFIGSHEVGWKLRSILAPGTRVALEHGGVAPVIVDETADLQSIVQLTLHTLYSMLTCVISPYLSHKTTCRH